MEIYSQYEGNNMDFEELIKMPQAQAEALVMTLSNDERSRILETISPDFIMQLDKELEEDAYEINEILMIMKERRKCINLKFY